MLPLSIWESESFFAPKEVIIVGSGFTGLWSAYYIKKMHPHWAVLILDRGIIPAGASTRNAGFACFGSLTELLSDSAANGEEEMLKLVEMRYRGLKKIRKHFESQDISYEETGGYELIPNQSPSDVNLLRTRIDQVNQKLKPLTGKGKTFILNDSKTSAFGFGGSHHLVENVLEGQLHSGKLCEALLQLVQSMGVKVLTQVETKQLEKSAGGFLLHTNLPVVLKAAKILVCTNAFAKTLLPDLDIKPARGQILVTAPLPVVKFKGCFHFDEGYYYFRNLGNRVLLGGARNKFFREEETFAVGTSGPVQDELERFLREIILPDTPYQIEYRWSGTMAVGKEKKPIVQKISDNLYCAVRMSGMGVVLAPEIGRMAAGLMNE
jgi:gamma-glutamylputrescine oxidase